MSSWGRSFHAAALAAIFLWATPAFGVAPAPPQLKPPAPAPAFIERSDLARLIAVREAISRRDYAIARALAKEMTDRTAKSLAEWYYHDAEDPLVHVESADQFLDAHPEWPSLGKIQAHAERRMSSTTAPDAVLKFFETRDPLTGEGKLQLARAQFASGAADAGALHVKDAWINNNFTLADEQRLLANYGGRLSAQDHAARVDRLLWSREATTAKRVFPRLSSVDRRRAEARAALLLGGSDGPRKYDDLSEEDRADPGVMLAAVRYYRRAEEEPRAIAIARGAPADPVVLRNPGRWWDEQQLLMRWSLKNRQYDDAYAMAARHALEPGTTEFAEAEFDAGWIALRFLNEPARAEKHFAALTANVSAPISLSRGWYWLARAAEARGDADGAAGRYGEAAKHIYTFYGQLAAEKIGGEALTKTFEETAPATAEEKARFSARPAVPALRMLTDLRDERAFLIFAFHIDDSLASRGEFHELANLAFRMNAPHVAVRAGKVAVKAGAFAPDIAYPDIGVPGAATRFAPAEIILGLSRQESEFNPRAFSSAGARGLMQLIPTTAQATARKERLNYSKSALLDDPHYNMTIGSAHLSHLIDRFGGSWVMTFAAYNAGANRVAQWVEAYGDPRGARTDPLDWIEQIPFEETRNYVQRVLENSQIYRSRLTGEPIAGALARDIERGGGDKRIAAISPVSAPGALPDVAPRILAFADEVLNQRIAASEALSHVRLKPPPPAKAARGGDSATKSPARSGRRPNFRQRKNVIPPQGPHDEAPSESIAPAKPAADVSKISEEQAPPPLVMDPVDDGARAIFESDEVIGEESPLETTPARALEPAAACVTYGDFIAETAKEDAAADDLNAGALAELRSGGDPCDEQRAN